MGLVERLLQWQIDRARFTTQLRLVGAEPPRWWEPQWILAWRLADAIANGP